MDINTALIFGAITAAITIANFWISRTKDSNGATGKMVEMMMKIDSLLNTVNEIKANTKETAKEVSRLSEDIVLMKAEIKSIWKNIDEFKKVRGDQKYDEG